jgi:hypothetical protein
MPAKEPIQPVEVPLPFLVHSPGKGGLDAEGDDDPNDGAAAAWSTLNAPEHDSDASTVVGVDLDQRGSLQSRY